MVLRVLFWVIFFFIIVLLDELFEVLFIAGMFLLGIFVWDCSIEVYFWFGIIFIVGYFMSVIWYFFFYMLVVRIFYVIINKILGRSIGLILIDDMEIWVIVYVV